MKNIIIKPVTLLLTLVLAAISGITQGVYSTSGSHLVLNGDVKLVMNNAGINVGGSITSGSGSLYFTGTSATASSFIGGSSPFTINNLVLNKSSNGIQLNQHLSVGNNIDFTSGDSLFLNGYNINLGTTGSLVNERGASRITGPTGGYIQVTSVLSGVGYQNPGNIGLAISSLSNLGITVIKRYPQQHSGLSIRRYFDVTPTVNIALNASVRLYYFDEELAGNLESSLGMFESFNNGTDWSNLGTDGSDYTNNYIQKNGLFALEHLTLSDASVALASNLLSFTGKSENGWNRLMWQTANETQATMYHLERSFNGKDFMEIAAVSGKGLLRNDYEFIDKLSGYGDSYYRIRIVEPGSRNYSAVVRIEGLKQERNNAGWSPNPASTQVILRVNAIADAKYMLKLSNSIGRIVLTKPIDLKTGMNTIRLDISNLPSGLYFINQKALYNQSGWLYIQK